MLVDGDGSVVAECDNGCGVRLHCAAWFYVVNDHVRRWAPLLHLGWRAH